RFAGRVELSSLSRLIVVAAAALALSAVVLGTASAAAPSAESMTILGIRIGQPLPFGPCDDRSMNPPTHCIEGSDYLGRSHLIFLRPDIIPEFVSGLRVRVAMVNGRVEGIDIPTTGIDGQEDAFDALVAKYGRPAQSGIETVQLRTGARIERIGAVW